MNNTLIDQDLLDKLHTVIMDSNLPLEGNVCYNHHSPMPLSTFEPVYETKRNNLVKLSNQVNHILEIGFNAGHSAAIMLSSNRSLNVTSVDIGYHAYTAPCARIVGEYFSNRHTIILKNSKHITSEEMSKADAVIIDGDHSAAGFFLDLALCMAYCPVGTIIVIDDWNHMPIQKTFKLFENFFSVYEGLENCDDQAFFLLSKSIRDY
jgi:hypothetical protein